MERRTKESFEVRGVRLTLGLQIQESALRTFFTQTGGLARGTGFLARFLLAWPESTQGHRPFSEPPHEWPSLTAHNARILSLLAQPLPMDDDGHLTPTILELSPEAKELWIRYYNFVEGALAKGGDLREVRDVASKSADNAARLAALFHVYERGTAGTIGAESMQSACAIAAWFLSEAQRFLGEASLPDGLVQAARLEEWLIAYCQRTGVGTVSKNDVRQRGPLRNGALLDAAIGELAALERLRLRKTGKRQTIELNPALLGGQS